MARTRRQLLGAVGVGLVVPLAGCGVGGGQVRDVQVDNRDGDTYTMSISVGDGSGGTLASREHTVDPLSEDTLADFIPEDPPDGSVVVSVTIEGIGVETKPIDVTGAPAVIVRITPGEQLRILTEEG